MSKRSVSPNRVKILNEVKEADKYTAYLKEQNEPFIRDMDSSSASVKALSSAENSSSAVSSSSQHKLPLSYHAVPLKREFQALSSVSSKTSSASGSTSSVSARSLVVSHAYAVPSAIGSYSIGPCTPRRIDRNLKQHARHQAKRHLRKHDNVRTYLRAADTVYQQETQPRYWLEKGCKANHAVNVCVGVSIFTAVLDVLIYLDTIEKGSNASPLLQEIMIGMLISSIAVIVACIMIGYHYNGIVNHSRYMKSYTLHKAH